MILNTVISINDKKFNNTRYNTGLREKPDEDLEILYCTFTDITSKKEGGAICLKSYRYSLFTFCCGFSLCASHTAGGAVYLNCYSYLAYKTCFYGCLALNSDQAVHSDVRKYARDEAADNTFNLTFICQCSPKQSQGQKRAVFLTGGMQIFLNSNFTNNHVREESSAMITSYPTIFNLKFCEFTKSSGTNLIWIHLIEDGFTLSYCNIYNNTLAVNKSSSVVVIEQSRAVFTRFIFFDNQCFHCMEGTYQVFLIECSFDFQFEQAIFGELKVSDKGSKFMTAGRKYKLKFAPTWDCWAIGSASPRATSILIHILNPQNSSTSLIIVILVLIVGGIVGFAIWFSQNTFIRDLEDLEPINIEN
ncbi:hypothetical protein TVAG_331310 [Trichomonas vaginalis G3]|uniref:Uncharacterized protein n=1 Tax=Trichomonas vaginalis (strain ATCC PRA-98 / G3) TaxID=412133 RepID=A2FRJ3_TRIV3|nr:hypothetical protein TVAGG3_1060910 [Trichomonas vaginalis G3]EAX92455.1 hypothetical protein TVAG_331310 [Trichomonas vaginalis G3]KAI5494678.1 hypothetical protein TVAGG3_1060910 [Trichomonas vaginalis G3]|eukprot:XP_001305385.1 hypothetical protein [Trichomonas vaginalis G3]